MDITKWHIRELEGEKVFARCVSNKVWIYIKYKYLTNHTSIPNHLIKEIENEPF